MSLLMQALKKAEQAKRSHAGEDDLVKPSEEYDEVLELAPQEPLPRNRRATDPVKLDVPADAADFSLEPIDPPAPAHDATLPDLPVPNWNEPQDPADIADAMHTAVPPAASEPPGEGPPTANARKPVPPQAGAARAARAEAARQRSRTGTPPPVQPPRQAPAAPMRAPNPRTMRLAALLGILFLIVATFGYLYWRAVYGPGSSKNLPPVPMPGMAGSTAMPAQPESGAIVVAPGAAPAYPAAPGYEAQAYTPPDMSAAPAQPVTAAPVPAPAAAGAPVPAPAPVQQQAPAVAAAPQAVPPPTPEQMQGMTPEDYARIDRQAAEAAAAANPGAASGVTITPSTTPPAVPQAPASSGVTTSPVAAMPPTTSGNAPVQVQQRTTSGEVNPALQSAYAALRQGDIDVAREQYNALLQTDPRNRDVLFGAAAIALRDRQPERAADIYARLLDADPNDADALAGLVAIRQADPVQTEARLRRIINLNPEAASALSALGHLYARQGRWSEAQQQYFKAYAVTPQSAENAFNLAVGLDRINQPKLALTYYQRALALAPGGAAGFNTSAVANRIRELGGR
ncbi:tetratricopeptide repeat protein [Pseudoduganella sp. GCM10020061]|uniref:tetratricopeptide repeat protein n=1 Tax=Pseudoduganella sp. GCM10020061 TaxID=3317345 RepID=UPI003644D37B